MWRLFIRKPLKRKRISAAHRKHKEQARALVNTKLASFNTHYGFTYGRIAIRDQRSRWGSCSEKKNLNFNYRIALLPERLVDYVIVHELCHVEEFNHSEDFWSLVGETIPDHRERRKELARLNLRALRRPTPSSTG